MYNPNYNPIPIDRLTPPVTVGEARKKAAYHGKIIQNNKGELSDQQLAHDYECLGYYNQIILKSNLKRNQK